MVNKTVNQNCVAMTHPDFAKLFWNENETYSNKFSSSKRVDFKCPLCNFKIENKIVWNIFKDGLSCPRCSDGISYPEKFMFNVLDQLGLRFSYQKTFKWSKNKKYDFYIPTVKCIIETHGRQHYKESGFNTTLAQQQENDRLKEQLAKENRIENYIVIDCRYSELEWIKENILKSGLNNIFDLSMIDWLKCHEYACSSLVKKVCDMWNDGSNIRQICKELRVSKTPITSYLKKGVILGWCEYDPKEEMRKNGKRQGDINGKEIVQLSLDGNIIREWKSARESERVLNLCFKTISDACRGRIKTYAGCIWLFKDKYEKLLSKNELTDFINELNTKNIIRRKVVQLSLDNKYIKTWNSIDEAQKTLNVRHISSVCRGVHNKAGGYKWVYEEEYIKEKGEV